jgi:hypothetical protein
VILDWETVDETDNDFFRILHSTDGISFLELDRVFGRGTTQSRSAYRYVHARPAAGVNYYRLEQVDFDGTTAILGVQSVHLDQGADAGASPSVYPNPAHSGGIVRLESSNLPRDTEELESVQVISLSGRVIANLILSPSGEVTLPAHLNSGLYLLRRGDQTMRLMVRP